MINVVNTCGSRFLAPIIISLKHEHILLYIITYIIIIKH